MVKTALIALFSVGLWLMASVGPCYAGDEFYIEIGGDVGKEQAASEWQKLLKTHKSLLGHLTFYPKTVLEDGKPVSTRIQAGPIGTKAKAEKVCNRLFREKMPCFVIEGMSSVPASSMENLSENGHPVKVVQLPWLAGSQLRPPSPPPPAIVEANADQPQKRVMLPWLNQGADTKPIADTKPAEQGQVDVAEAIRVPLSASGPQEGSDIMIKSLPPESLPAPKEQAPANEDEREEIAEEGTGWLTVSTFPDDDIAMAFWEEARTGSPVKTRNLHVRVLRPMLSRGGTILSIGPFASNEEALEFCHDTLQAADRGLHCSYGGREPGAADIPQVGQAGRSHGDAYIARRAEVASRHAPAEISQVAPGKAYWVQVLTATSQMSALQQWNDMKAANKDLLGDMRATVSSPSNEPGTFVIRAGPIATSSDADNLCATLQNRGTDCRVLLFSSPHGH